jgi:putative ABC transport system permease protein
VKTLRRLFRRLTSWATSAQDEELLRTEFEEHLAMQTAENIRSGLSPIEARRQALLKFGSVEAIKDAYRDQRGLPFIETLVSDTRHALRRMRKAPGFTAAVIVTLALGIGANTATFGVIDSILIRPLAYPQAEALVSVWHTAPGLPGLPLIGLSPSMYFTYREESRSFEQFGLWSSSASVTGVAEPEMPRALFVTYGVLEAAGVKPLLGRWFSQTDDTPGSAETVMLTYGYWQRRFGGDTSIIGRTLTIDSRPRTVIGVMPEAFRFQRDPELILPQRFEHSTQFPANFGYQGIARLKPGVTIEQTNADVARLLGVWLNAWPPNPGVDRAVFQNARFGLAEAQQAIWSVNGRQPVFLVTTLKTLYDQSMAWTSFTLVMLAIAGGMGLVLGIVGIYGVIAYVVSQRIREIGIRTALGAQPAGLLGMFVRYGLWLAGIGAALGLVAAAGLTRLMSSLLFGVTALDPVTYAAVSVLLIVAGVLASYLPARRAIAVDPVQALRAE